MSFTKLLYHIVFATKHRAPVIHPAVAREVYLLLYRQIVRLGGKVYRINGMPDHLHLLVDLPTTTAISDVVKITKQESSKHIREMGIIPLWDGWQEGYGIFTVGFNEKNLVIDYIFHQQEHHLHKTFLEEYRDILVAHGFDPSETFFPKEEVTC